MHPAKMTFQALRVAVNREFAELRDGLASGDGGLWLEWRRCGPDVEARRVCCCGRLSGYALVGREGFNATQV